MCGECGGREATAHQLLVCMSTTAGRAALPGTRYASIQAAAGADHRVQVQAATGLRPSCKSIHASTACHRTKQAAGAHHQVQLRALVALRQPRQLELGLLEVALQVQLCTQWPNRKVSEVPTTRTISCSGTQLSLRERPRTSAHPTALQNRNHAPRTRRTCVNGGDRAGGVLVHRAHDCIAPAHERHLLALGQRLQAVATNQTSSVGRAASTAQHNACERNQRTCPKHSPPAHVLSSAFV